MHPFDFPRSWVLGLSFACLTACGDSNTDAADATVDASSDAKADAPPPGPNTCVEAGGRCQCAGGCDRGFLRGSFAEDNACPQPCPTCGGCSQWCCKPDPDAGSDADARSDSVTDGG